MTKRVSVEDRLSNEKKESPRDSLFQSTEQIEVKKDNNRDSQFFKRQTYYISEELIDALTMYKAFEDKDISVIVREALYEYIPEEYLKRARDKHK